MIKSSPETGYRGDIPQHNKGHLEKAMANIIRNGEKLKAFPLRYGTSQECPLVPLLFNIVLEVLGTPNQTRKRNKRKPNQKGRSTTVTFCR